MRQVDQKLNIIQVVNKMRDDVFFRHRIALFYGQDDVWDELFEMGKIMQVAKEVERVEWSK